MFVFPLNASLRFRGLTFLRSSIKKEGMQTKRLWFIFDPWSQGAGSDHCVKSGILFCYKINPDGCVSYQVMDNL